MINRDIAAAWKYHNATKHSYASIRSNPHMLDWANKPLAYKIYPTLEVTRLPTEAHPTAIPALSAISALTANAAADALPNLEILAQILFLSAGITKARKYPGGEIFFRAAACTGALYEIELYLVCGDLPDLPAGLYHFGVAEFGLRQLRAGDFRASIAEFAGHDACVRHAPVTIICTGTYWRNAWKYQARTYRHFGWDNGTILANMLAVSTALGLPAKVIAGFMDEQVNGFLGLDSEREVAFSLVSLGPVVAEAMAAPGAVTALHLPLNQPSQREVDYPLMREMHTASSLSTADEVKVWHERTPILKPPPVTNMLITLPRIADTKLPTDSIEEVILRRGSTRHFAQVPITITQLSALLDRATRGITADFLHSAGARLNDLYLIVNDVEGVPSGAYFYRREQHGLEHLRQGNFRHMAGYLGLEQELPAAASVCLFFLADLHGILEAFGNRGYRATQLEAGIIGGKVYLAAYALRLGATGLTFYDDDVVRFFSPHAEGKSAIFLVAVGKSRAKMRI
ncbi:MAG TPA: SagB/ThcOx family dehydrogenase [Terriglobales bacterium]|nr:SagB/ThcOx family dehydrogenase [Terriglobales bacterium]